MTQNELDDLRDASTGALFARRHIERKFGPDHELTYWARALYAHVSDDATAAVIQWMKQGFKNP
jgi:hypothetical protein